MLLDPGTVCKPLVQRELLFYLNIPRQLRDFVPDYKGCVEIRNNESATPLVFHPTKLTATFSSAANLAVPTPHGLKYVTLFMEYIYIYWPCIKRLSSRL